MYPGTCTMILNQSTAEREWFAQNYEKIKNQDLKAEEQVEIAKLMSKSQVDNIVIQIWLWLFVINFKAYYAKIQFACFQRFDQFVDTKFKTIKRYGGEGGESAMVFYNELFKLAAEGNMLSLSNRQSSYILQQATAITIMMYASRESSVCPHYFVSL